jgi:hypothetical protein
MATPHSSAFPFDAQHQGLSKRELLAAMAMQGLLAGGGNNNMTEALVASTSVKYADLLLAELDKGKRVCPVKSVLDGRGLMSSERRALLCPRVNRAIRAKNNSGAAGFASGSKVA